MSPLTADTAATLPPAQAAGLARVIDLQAQWENLQANPGRAISDYSLTDLHGRQRAYEAFRTVRAEYAARYQAAPVPETALGTPEWFAVWCRVVRAVFRMAGDGVGPAHTVEKIYRLADRIASRLNREPVRREPPGGMAEAIRTLDAVIQWCDELGSSPTPVVRLWTAGNEAVA